MLSYMDQVCKARQAQPGGSDYCHSGIFFSLSSVVNEILDILKLDTVASFRLFPNQYNVKQNTVLGKKMF